MSPIVCARPIYWSVLRAYRWCVPDRTCGNRRAIDRNGLWLSLHRHGRWTYPHSDTLSRVLIAQSRVSPRHHCSPAPHENNTMLVYLSLPPTVPLPNYSQVSYPHHVRIMVGGRGVEGERCRVSQWSAKVSNRYPAASNASNSAS